KDRKVHKIFCGVNSQQIYPQKICDGSSSWRCLYFDPDESGPRFIEVPFETDPTRLAPGVGGLELRGLFKCVPVFWQRGEIRQRDLEGGQIGMHHVVQLDGLN